MDGFLGAARRRENGQNQTRAITPCLTHHLMATTDIMRQVKLSYIPAPLTAAAAQ